MDNSHYKTFKTHHVDSFYSFIFWNMLEFTTVEFAVVYSWNSITAWLILPVAVLNHARDYVDSLVNSFTRTFLQSTVHINSVHSKTIRRQAPLLSNSLGINREWSWLHLGIKENRNCEIGFLRYSLLIARFRILISSSSKYKRAQCVIFVA
jgi:hypothetical protein